MTIILFLAVLFVLILVHEWGHFIVAKKTGMRVDEFAIGFPPKLFGIKKGETEYTINLLPIGGFVRIWGEDGTNVPSSPLTPEGSDGRSEASAEAARGGTNTNEVDASRAFSRRPKWAQTAVLIAGVSMNIIFAWFLFIVVFLLGVPTAVEEGEQSENARLVITEVLQDGPAQEAGIPVGAEIIAYNESNKELIPSAFRTYTTEAEKVTITYEAQGEEKMVEVTPKAGLVAEDPELKVIGIRTSLVETIRRPFFTAVYDATVMTVSSTGAIVAGITKLLGDIVQLDADLSQVAGPVGIVGLVGDAAEFGFASLLMFTAMISLNLAVINLLPFPALDGGRLLFVGIEAVTKRAIDPVWVARLNTIGFVLLMALMFAVTYSDISKLL